MSHRMKGSNRVHRRFFDVVEAPSLHDPVTRNVEKSHEESAVSSLVQLSMQGGHKQSDFHNFGGIAGYPSNEDKKEQVEDIMQTKRSTSNTLVGTNDGGEEDFTSGRRPSRKCKSEAKDKILAVACAESSSKRREKTTRARQQHFPGKGHEIGSTLPPSMSQNESARETILVDDDGKIETNKKRKQPCSVKFSEASVAQGVFHDLAKKELPYSAHKRRRVSSRHKAERDVLANIVSEEAEPGVSSHNAHSQENPSISQGKSECRAKVPENNNRKHKTSGQGFCKSLADDDVLLGDVCVDECRTGQKLFNEKFKELVPRVSHEDAADKELVSQLREASRHCTFRKVIGTSFAEMTEVEADEVILSNLRRKAIEFNPFRRLNRVSVDEAGFPHSLESDQPERRSRDNQKRSNKSVGLKGLGPHEAFPIHLRDTDVITDDRKSEFEAHRINVLYNSLLKKYALQLRGDNERRLVDVIIENVRAQNPHGQFVSLCGNILASEEMRKEVTRSLRKVARCLQDDLFSEDAALIEHSLVSERCTSNAKELSSISTRSLAANQVRHFGNGDVHQGSSSTMYTAREHDGSPPELVERAAPESHKSHDSTDIHISSLGLPDVRLDTYVEDVAWRLYGNQKSNEHGYATLPPPIKLPDPPTQTSCIWKVESENRVIRVRLKSSCTRFTVDDKQFLMSTMEKDDVTVITEGLCENLDKKMWNLKSIETKAGHRFHHRFRRFKRREADSYLDTSLYHAFDEMDGDYSMKLSDFFRYLEKRRQAMSGEKSITTTRRASQENREFTYTDEKGMEITIDVLDDILYLLDYDLKKQLPNLFIDFKEKFAFPEFLPGGAMCAMNAVNGAAQPDMGPNMYITPPGSFTRFHQDGYGTVDSGHMCLSGYNEVVIFRRLPRDYDKNAINQDTGIDDVGCETLYEMPHADKLGIVKWPSNFHIQRCRDMGYSVSVLTLGPNEFIHIGKGRFHAFRKMGSDPLPEDDCHSDLRREIHAKLRADGVDIRQLVNVSVAWDWSYMGLTAEGMNREIVYTLESAFQNRGSRKPKQSLAIPKLCLLSNVETSVAALENDDSGPSLLGIRCESAEMSSDRNREIVRGLLPALEYVVSVEQETYARSQTTAVISDRPNSWENPLAFPLDPFGSDYSCKVCLQELANIYLHCNGCENLLQKDFNICPECHEDGAGRHFFQLDNRWDNKSSFLNHTGHFPSSHDVCEKKVQCDDCSNCVTCSCVCHHSFTLHQRMWKNDRLSAIVEKARAIVGDNQIPYSIEVAPRLQLAQKNAAAHRQQFSNATVASNRNAIRPLKKKKVTSKSAARAGQSFPLDPYVLTEISFPPSSHLDISPEAISFMAPMTGVEVPSLGSSPFDIVISPEDFKVLLSSIPNSKDMDRLSDIDLHGLSAPQALNLYRNFVDAGVVSYNGEATFFSPRELDIIAFAQLQARENTPIGSPRKRKGKGNLFGVWALEAWKLMPYREKTKFINKCYARIHCSFINKLEGALEDKNYLKHLEEKVSILFRSVRNH